jgi:hypothetical protein
MDDFDFFEEEDEVRQAWYAPCHHVVSPATFVGQVWPRGSS